MLEVLNRWGLVTDNACTQYQSNRLAERRQRLTSDWMNGMLLEKAGTWQNLCDLDAGEQNHAGTRPEQPTPGQAIRKTEYVFPNQNKMKQNDRELARVQKEIQRSEGTEANKRKGKVPKTDPDEQWEMHKAPSNQPSKPTCHNKFMGCEGYQALLIGEIKDSTIQIKGQGSANYCKSCPTQYKNH